MATKIRKANLEWGSATPWNSKYYGTNELWETWFHQVPWAISSLWTKVLSTYWETIPTAKLSMFGKWGYINTESVDILNALANSWNLNVWHTTSIRIQQPFYVGKYNVLRSVAAQILKVWAPTDTFQIQIYDTDRTTLLKTSSNIISLANPTWLNPLTWSTITGSYLTYTFILDNLQLQSYKTYRMEFRRVWAADWSNYYAVSYNSTDQGQKWNKRWSPELHNGTARTRIFNSDEWVTRYIAQFWQLCEAGKVYACNSDFIEKSLAECVTEESKVASETWLVTVSWVNNTFTNLAKWKKYNLNNYVLGWEQKTYNTTWHFWYATTDNEKISQSFVLSKSCTISKIMLSIIKAWSPTDDAIVRIETNNISTWEATWTLVSPNATFTIPYHRLYTYHYANVWDFNWEFTLTAWETYHIVLTRSGLLNTSNYFTSSSYWGNVNWRWKVKSYENSAWTTETQSLFYDFLTNQQELWQFTWNVNTVYIWYDSDTHNIHAQTFMVTNPTSIDWVALRLQKAWSPTQWVRLRIESNVKLDIWNSTNMYCNTSWNSRQAFWNTTIKKTSMLFKWVWDISARFLSLYINKVLSPIDNITVRIETDNAWAPSWNLVSANATSTFDCSQYWTSASFYAQFEFASNITLLWWVNYWIVLERTWTDSAVNYFQVYYQDSVYANGAMSTSTDWTNRVTTIHDMMFFFSASYYEWWYEPSWVLVDPSATAVVSAASIATSYNRQYKFQFPSSITLIPNTIYWIVVEPENKYDNTSNFYYIWNYNSSVPAFRYKYQDKQARWKSVNNNRKLRFAFQNRLEPIEWSIWLNPWNYYWAWILSASDTNWLISRAWVGKNSICWTIPVSTTFSFTAISDWIMFLTGAWVNNTWLTIREYLDPTQITETENFDLSIWAIAFTSVYSFPVVAWRTYKIITPVTYTPKYRLLSS